MQVQESGPATGNEANTPNVSLDSSNVNDLDLPIAVRKGTRTCTQYHLYPLSHFVSYERLSPSHINFLSHQNIIAIPKTPSEAINNEEWKQAMKVEMEALEKNGPWDLVELPRGKTKREECCEMQVAVRSKVQGIFSWEIQSKTRCQRLYSNIWSRLPRYFRTVAKMNIVRVLLSLAVQFNWDLQQFNVKNAFLHGELEEEIYIWIFHLVLMCTCIAIKIWPSHDDDMCPSNQKPPSLRSHSRNRSSPQGRFHPDSSDTPSHPGVHHFPQTSAPDKITSATDHPWFSPSATLQQQIIHDLCRQFRSLIFPHVLNVRNPLAWTVMNRGGFLYI